MQETSKTKRNRVLVVDDEESIRFTFTHFLQEAGFDVVTSPSLASAKKLISASPVDLVFLDLMLKGESGMDLLKEINKLTSNCPVIIITGKPTLGNATEALRHGAFDFLIKPVRKDDLLHATGLAINHKMLLDANEKITLEKESCRANLEAIFQSVGDGIITVDENLKVMEVNNQVEALCGIQKKCIQGRHLEECLKTCGHGCIDVISKTLLTRKPVKDIPIQCIRRDETRQVVNVSTSPLINKNEEFKGVVSVIRDITRLHDLEEELKERSHFHNIVGRNKRIQNIFSLVEALSNLDTMVLITGESGTGKELVANALHYSGKRSSKPFIKVNCAALAENLLESELFGHVKGAFTGALKDVTGRFEMAKDGTILLDEIGDISHRIQVKLLRVLEEKKFEKVGDSKPRKVKARLIASTNKDLREQVRRGEFREDLYYRLNVVEIEIPPLRERRDDLPLLVDHFRNMFEATYKKTLNDISEEVLDLFMNYHWPGNIRELMHVIEHAFVVCNEGIIKLEHLPPYLGAHSHRNVHTHTVSPGEENEYGLMIRILEQTDWNIAKAARILNMSRPTLYKKIREHKLTRKGLGT